ncbi:MAG: aldo/keto reductase [Planctomycetia bacterium]|nr:aldo/keto reductase [Planctomycetia bacterium]
MLERRPLIWDADGNVKTTVNPIGCGTLFAYAPEVHADKLADIYFQYLRDGLFIDTAWMYGSEKYIREAIDMYNARGGKKIDITLQFKSETKTHSYEETQQQYADILERYGLEAGQRQIGNGSFDISYLGHNITSSKLDLTLSDAGVFGFLRKLKAEGKIDAIGLSTHEYIVARQVVDEDCADVVLVPYNAYDHILGNKWEQLAADARGKGIGVIAMKPYLGLWVLRDKVSQVAAGEDMERIKDGLIWYLLADQNVSTIISSSMSIAEAHDTIERVERYPGWERSQKEEFAEWLLSFFSAPIKGMKEYAGELSRLEYGESRECRVCKARIPFSMMNGLMLMHNVSSYCASSRFDEFVSEMEANPQWNPASSDYACLSCEQSGCPIQEMKNAYERGVKIVAKLYQGQGEAFRNRDPKEVAKLLGLTKE